MVVRQLTIVSLRIGLIEDPRARPVLVAGGPLPEEFADIELVHQPGVWYVVWLSSTCATCRKIARELLEFKSLDGDMRRSMMLLLTGPPQTFADIAAEEPVFGGVLQGSTAEGLVASLALDTSPLVVETESGWITGWTTLESLDDVHRLRDARATSNAAALALQSEARVRPPEANDSGDRK